MLVELGIRAGDDIVTCWVRAPTSLQPATFVGPPRRAGREEACKDRRDPTPDRDRRIEQTENLLRGKLWGPQKKRPLAHVRDHVVGKSEQSLHHALIEESGGEPGILRLHTETAIESLELKSHLGPSKGALRVVEQIARRHPQPRGGGRERNHGAREPPADADGIVVAWILVPEVEDANVRALTPIPDHVLRPPRRMPEHRER